MLCNPNYITSYTNTIVRLTDQYFYAHHMDVWIIMLCVILLYTDGNVQLDINNRIHHKVIQQLSKYLDQDGTDHRMLYRYFNLSQRQKDMVEDSKTSKVYESLAQYIETENPTVLALVRCLKDSEVKDDRIQFIINYKYQWL